MMAVLLPLAALVVVVPSDWTVRPAPSSSAKRHAQRWPFSGRETKDAPSTAGGIWGEEKVVEVVTRALVCRV